ncbi:hypothetical protein PG990_007980 [Apiospora arundinis]
MVASVELHTIFLMINYFTVYLAIASVWLVRNGISKRRMTALSANGGGNNNDNGTTESGS